MRICEGECEARPYLELVIGAMYLLVVIDFKRIQELEVQSEAPLYPDAIVAAQIWWVGLRVFKAREVARGLRVQSTAAFGYESKSRTREVIRALRLAQKASAQPLPPPHPNSASPWQDCPSF